jgi:predicted DsbA family dithiol-disulfide isomerase
MLLIRNETLERIAAEYGIEDDEMNEILKESKEDTEKFKKEIKDAVMNAIKSIKIDIIK